MQERKSMTTHGKQYRGEDTTLETIRSRTFKMFYAEFSIEPTEENATKVDFNRYEEIWNETCTTMAQEMLDEGLTNTAEDILSYKTK